MTVPLTGAPVPPAEMPLIADRAPAAAKTAPAPATPIDGTASKAARGSQPVAGRITPAVPDTMVPPQPTATPLHPARIAPAADMFAAAIQRAARDERRPVAVEAAFGLTAPAVDPTARIVPAETSHAALDMARETWPARMIERIELLRDAADAADTNIRLVPDRLGTIDVTLRREGDSVAVQFTAHQAETRQLLAEAQPRLAEMADAKGLRLSMHSGDGSGQPHEQRHAARASTITPREPSDDDGIAADERIA